VVTLIGSREGCKVNLRHRRAAPVHTALVNNGSEIIAVDLLTPAGTLLNGLQLQHETLSDGDLLTVDQWELRVEIEQPDSNGNGNADAHPFDLEPTPNVVALEHLETGRVLQPNRAVCLIGRRNGCDIALPDSRVSRAHVLLVNYFGYPAILDLLTPNGTMVNNTPIQFQALKDSDVVTIGDAQFRIRFVGSAVAKRSSTNHKPAAPRVALAKEPVSADLIDIQQTEGAQSWRIADNLEHLEKATGKRRAV
jgi:pSer/pThr/pTyr-binding forkhead associated (FHA) protein